MILNNLLKNQNLKQFWLVLFISILVVVFYFQSVRSLFELWVTSGNSTYSHGSILFLVALYAFLKRFDSMSPTIVIKNDIFGWVALMMVSFIWGGFIVAGIKVGYQLLIVMIFPICLWFLFGIKMAWKISIPLFLILFAIPVWETINQGQLQIMTAYLVTKLLILSGFLVYREGIDIMVTAGSFRVAENCSGIRLLLVAMPLSLIFSYINQLRLKYAIIFFVVSILAAVITNLIRIYIVIVAGQLTKMQHYFVTEDHVTLGWVLFAFIFLILFTGSKKILGKFNAAEMTSASNKVTNKSLKTTSVNMVRTMTLVLIGLLPGPLYIQYVQNTDLYINEDVKVEVSSGWEIEANDIGFTPILLPADWEYRQGYVKDDKRINLYINYYSVQRDNSKALSKINSLYDRDKWHLITSTIVNFQENNSNNNITANMYLIENNAGQQKYIWQWYYLWGKHTGKYSYAKLLSILGAFINYTDASMIILEMDVLTDSRATGNILEEFASLLIKPVTNVLETKLTKQQKSEEHDVQITN